MAYAVQGDVFFTKPVFFIRAWYDIVIIFAVFVGFPSESTANSEYYKAAFGKINTALHFYRKFSVLLQSVRLAQVTKAIRDRNADFHFCHVCPNGNRRKIPLFPRLSLDALPSRF